MTLIHLLAGFFILVRGENIFLGPYLSILLTKGFVFYGVTFDLCRFCTFLNSAQLAGWAKFKNVQNLPKSNVTP